MEKNLTTGNIFKTIVYFALPYLLSYFLQTLYGMADLFITGQFNGVDAITAVSNGSQVMHMLTVIIVGLAMGATVTISRAIGADKKTDAARAIGNTVTLFMAVSILFTAILLCLVKQIIVLIGIPTEAVAGTTSYLIICFIGIPFITAYNIISSIFRGIGDSKTPMYFIAVACAANIILDYGLTDDSFEQLSFFEDTSEKERRQKLDAALDSIRIKFGNDKVTRASLMNSNARIGRKARAQMENERE